MNSLFLQIPGYGDIYNPVSGKPELWTLGGFISAILFYIFIVSGLILFGAIIWSGFNMLTSGGSPEKLKSAKGCLTNAFVGFFIILVAYGLIQLVGYILGIEVFK